ncbi:hypothetical protein BS50DRAFT_579136 [Corynespora cassiicola Philippines]|uniref:Mid2 domain-containing protein n=1 Tax=Corynespora cassiicola Philippines TaxID=1448308 RepID=A0A2T2N5A6_CORCC|nr:hypothetical protein BS50DRAFT_579136 [Corynespora cassiicola Philippines]
MGLSRLSRLSLLLVASTTIISTTQAYHLFARQSETCGGIDNLAQCGSEFPSEFCCPKDATCLPLNSTGVQSVICCPSGMDCAFIQPITCDISQFNATLHPDNQVHLSDTKDLELPKCGEKCCPLGYTCNGGMCSAITEAPSPTSSATPTSPTPSATDPASASQTSNAPPPIVPTDPGFDGKSFAAGFIPGIVIGILLTLGIIWIIKKRRESAKNRYSGDFGHVARTISDPIYDPEYAARTDFIRQASHSTRRSPSSTTNMMQKNHTNIGTRAAGGGGLTPRIKSMWDRTPKLTFSGWGTPAPVGLPPNPAPPPPAIRAGNRDPYITPGQTPRRVSRTPSTRTPRRTQSRGKRPEAARSGSTETIDVLMPTPSFLAPPKAPGMQENRFTQDSGHTTFTKLMERAGFEEGSRDQVRDWGTTPQRGR